MKQVRQHQINALNAMANAIRGIINLPTGTGKSLIQSRSIVEQIKQSPNTHKVYIILSPRILLSNQLMQEVRTDLTSNGIGAQYAVIHSGQCDENEDQLAFEKLKNISYRDVKCGTDYATIRDAFNRCVAEDVPLVICGTYHSADRISGSGIPIEIVYCDEAHYLVPQQFSWIPTSFETKKIFFFTATLRHTDSEDGMGMNNVKLFGEVLYSEIPIELINKGEMVRPRMHLVDMSHDPESDEGDGLAVASAFNEHRAQLNIGAKLLVVAKDGSDHLDSLASHPQLLRLLKVRKQLTIFDISSAYGPRINGVKVNRTLFLNRLRTLSDMDEAIIIHCDILTEGIDVPGITGILPLTNMGGSKSKFLQTLGRATRLHNDDRSRLYNGDIVSSQLDEFVKPYAWIIIPVYGQIGDDMREYMTEMVSDLRSHGFNPSEDIVVRQHRGTVKLAPLVMVNDLTDGMKSVLDFSSDVLHTIENQEMADNFKLEMMAFAKKSLHDKTIELFKMMGVK